MPELYTSEHEDFRKTARTFYEREVIPHHDQWEQDGIVPRELWLKAGEAGLLCFDVPEEYGGPGVDDFRYNVILSEEQTRAGVSGPGFSVHTDIIVPYLTSLATDEQKQRWLPGTVSGETITAIAMTEPGAGSDLQGVRTTAVDKGDHYLLNGSKTFISNGILADLVIVVARTDPEAGHKGISLLVVERGMEGFERGRNLDKIGLHAQDTAELSFTDVVVPKENLLGEEGQGFIYLMMNLPQERLIIAAQAVAAAEAIVEMCLDYAKTREAFGKPIGKFQHNRFLIAEMATEVRVARAFINECMAKHLDGKLTAVDASMAKWWCTELQNKLVNQGVQLHGGYGYMMEFPIAKAYLDSRISTIYGGTTEIQKEIIGRSLGPLRPMDFDLPDTALAVRDGVAAVAAKYDHEYWSRCEDEKRYPIEIYRDLSEGGWLGLSVPEEYGGGGQGLLETAIACETLCASGGTAGSFFYVLNPGFGVTTLARHGTDEQKQQILPGLASGEIQFSFGLTEPDAGSNAIEISTSARRDGRPTGLPDQGPEDLDLQRRARRLDGRGHPHHPGEGGEAPHRRVHALPRRRQGGPRRRHAELHPDPQDGVQHPLLQPGVLRRRTRPGPPRAGRGRRGLPGAVGRAQPRAHPGRGRWCRCGRRRAEGGRRLRP